MIETDVLIVGSGPAGSSSALFLSTYGVQNMVITKYRWTANTPRAHITNQRAVEIMRDMGLEDEIKAKGVPNHLMGDTVFCASLAGDELARLHTWGTHPQRLADYTLASPCTHYDLPQDIFEPIILGEAARRGSRVRFDTEYLSHVQDADGVTVTVQDRIGGERLRDPRQVPDRRRRRALEDRAGHRAADGGRDGLGGIDEHRLPRRPLQATSRTGRASSTGSCSRAPTWAGSAWASCGWCARGTSG